MLIDSLEKLQTEGQPQKLDEVFSDNKESILYEKLTASLREAAAGIKENMKGEIGQMISQSVQEAMGNVKLPRDGVDGQRGQDGKNATSPNPKEVAKLIVSMIPKPDVIDEEKIVSKVLTRIPRAGRGGGDTIIADDLSSQCTGATRTFTTTKRIGKPILVVSSQFPNVLRLTVDFTASGMTLTLDSALGFIESGQTLYFIFSEG